MLASCMQGRAEGSVRNGTSERKKPLFSFVRQEGIQNVTPMIDLSTCFPLPSDPARLRQRGCPKRDHQVPDGNGHKEDGESESAQRRVRGAEEDEPTSVIRPYNPSSRVVRCWYLQSRGSWPAGRFSDRPSNPGFHCRIPLVPDSWGLLPYVSWIRNLSGKWGKVIYKPSLRDRQSGPYIRDEGLSGKTAGLKNAGLSHLCEKGLV